MSVLPYDTLLNLEKTLFYNPILAFSSIDQFLPYERKNQCLNLYLFSKLLNERLDWNSVGLCSSASHLRRALKEAEAQGLALIPVPGDFRSTPLVFSPLYLIPQGRGFRDVQTALWEFLGGLF